MSRAIEAFVRIVPAAVILFCLGCPSPSSAPDSTAPAELVDLRHLADEGSVTFAWIEPADADFASVEISWTPGGEVGITVGRGTVQASVTGLSNGTAYTFMLVTVDSLGNRSSGSTVTATPTPTLYVRTDGDDANPGTRQLPKRSIQAIIDASQPVEIRIAAGVYAESITLQAGFSLKGGYSASDWFARGYATAAERADASYETEISASGAYAISCGSTVSGSTCVEGLTITGGGTDDSAGVYIDDASPWIQFCTVDGGTGTLAAYGIVVYGSCSPILRGCVLRGGTSGTSGGIALESSLPICVSDCTITGMLGTSQSWGIYIDGTGTVTLSNNFISGGLGTSASYGINANTAACILDRNTIVAGGNGASITAAVNTHGNPLTITNNTIEGGEGSSHSHGISMVTAAIPAPTIANNTISGGSGGTAYAIDLQNDGGGIVVSIENNILFTTGGANRYGVWVSDSSCALSSLKNNDLFNCPTELYYNSGSTAGYTDDECGIAFLNEFPNAAGNVRANPAFVEAGAGNWRFTAPSPVGVTQGGLTIAGVTLDRDGNARTTPYSIGAFEKD